MVESCIKCSHSLFNHSEIELCNVYVISCQECSCDLDYWEWLLMYGGIRNLFYFSYREEFENKTFDSFEEAYEGLAEILDKPDYEELGQG